MYNTFVRRVAINAGARCVRRATSFEPASRFYSNRSMAESNMEIKSGIPLPRAPSCLRSHDQKREIVLQLLTLKDASGLSFDHMASKLGYTNVYLAQILLLQAPIKSKEKAEMLRDMLCSKGGEISDDLLDDMQRCPFRSVDDETLEDPTIARFIESVRFNGEALKSILNEKFGDGVMSPVGMSMKLNKVKDSKGNSRVQIVFDAPFLPWTEQLDE